MTTAKLSLPEIAHYQASKEVTHNEALWMLDWFVPRTVKDRDLSTPPGSPSTSDAYLVATGGTDEWNGHDGEIAHYWAEQWNFYTVWEGLTIWVEDENLSSTYTGATWVDMACGVDDITIEISSGLLQVKDGGIDTDQLANDAVTDSKVATGINAAKIGGGSVSNTEFGYLNGVTSGIQTQINTKLPTATYESASSIDPGHKHSKLWASDGSPEAVEVAADGQVTISNALTIDSNTFYPLILDSHPNGGGIHYKVAGTSKWYAFVGGTDNFIFSSNTNNNIFTIEQVGISKSLTINPLGNIGFGTSSFGTNAQKVLCLAQGVQPTTVVADAVQLFCSNAASETGKATLCKISEGAGAVKEIIPGVYYKTDTGDPANAYEGLMCLNTQDNNIKMYADGGWRTLATW